MKLSIIIPVKNDAKGLEACLRSIKRAAIDSIEYEQLVVDNGSTDNSVEVANKYGAHVTMAPDVTISTLRNLAAKQAKGDVLAFIDADCSVGPNWFESIQRHIDNSEVVCFGCPPTIPDNATWVQSCWYQVRRKISPDQPAFEIEWLESMNMFVRRDAFQAVEGFDESMITCEDYDLCIRLKEQGNILCDNRIIAIHHGEADTTQRFYKKERWRGSSNLQSLRKHGFALSELPSVLFPLLHVIISIVALISLAAALSGAFPLSFWILGIVIWQLPLLLLGLKKSASAFRWQQAFGIGVLLNLYFLARGLSLFTPASWGGPHKIASSV